MYAKTESRTACQATTLQGADAGKPPFDQVSLTLYSSLCRFCAVKLSFLFGNHFVVSKLLVDPRISSNVTDQYVVRAGSRAPDVSDQGRVESDHTHRISKPDQLHGSHEVDQRTGAGTTRGSPHLSQGY